ncbi:MAG: hypothetical protein V4463_17940 [Pseudomonadota bacterium]
MRATQLASLLALLVGCTAAGNSAADICGDKDTTPIAGNSFVVRNVRVFDGEQMVDNNTVVVRAGRIVSANHDSPPSGLPVVEGYRRTLLAADIDHPGTLKQSTRYSIVPGAAANLVLVNGNPMVDAKATPAVVRMFKDGYEVRRSALLRTE